MICGCFVFVSSLFLLFFSCAFFLTFFFNLCQCNYEYFLHWDTSSYLTQKHFTRTITWPDAYTRSRHLIYHSPDKPPSLSYTLSPLYDFRTFRTYSEVPGWNIRPVLTSSSSEVLFNVRSQPPNVSTEHATCIQSSVLVFKAFDNLRLLSSDGQHKD